MSLPASLRPVKRPENVTSTADAIHCTPYRVARLTVLSCLKRRAAKRAGDFQTDVGLCGDCPIGNVVEAKLGCVNARKVKDASKGGYRRIAFEGDEEVGGKPSYSTPIAPGPCTHTGCPSMRGRRTSVVPGGDTLCISHRKFLSNRLIKEGKIVPTKKTKPNGIRVIEPVKAVAMTVFEMARPAKPPMRAAGEEKL